MAEMKLPDVGEGIHEAEIVNWHVEEGDTIEEDDVLVEIETDKAVVDIPSSYTGTVQKLHFKEGDTVNVDDVIATIGEGEPQEETSEKPEEETGDAEAETEAAESTEEETGEAETKEEESTEKTGEAGEEEPEKRESVSVVGTLEEAPDEEPEEKTEQKEKKSGEEEPTAKEKEEKVLATPKVRKLAEEKNVDLTKINGSGEDGRVTEEDVNQAAKTGEEEAETEAAEEEGTVEAKHKRKYDMFGHISREPYKGTRKVIGENMRESVDTAAHVAATEMVDITHLWEIKDHEKEAAAEDDITLTLSPFIIKAVAHALKQHPLLNAELNEEEEEIIKKEYYNIGFAVDTDHGLLVPVLKNVGDKSILDLAEEAEKLADEARNREIDRMDMKGHTFTVTNYGSIGGWFGTPIINPGNSAILGIGRVQKLPWVVDDEIEIRRVLPLSLSFDHRVLDGAEAARFMNTLKEYLEDPDKLLIEED